MTCCVITGVILHKDDVVPFFCDFLIKLNLISLFPFVVQPARLERFFRSCQHKPNPNKTEVSPICSFNSMLTVTTVSQITWE